MRRILKAVVLAWITKKLYSRFARSGEPELPQPGSGPSKKAPAIGAIGRESRRRPGARWRTFSSR